MDYIVYIGDSLGIENSAMHEHAIAISKIFQEMNYSTIFVSNLGWHPGESSERDIITNQYRFHCYYSETIPLPNDSIRKWYRRFQSLTGFVHWKVIKQVLECYKPKIIIFYGYICMKNVIKYSKKHNIKLLVERTDWFDKTFYTDIYNRLIWCNYTNRCIQKLSFKADGVIAISDFFYRYYCQCVPTIQIPALCNNVEYTRKESNTNSIIKMVYAGSPGTKDLLRPAIEAVKHINKDHVQILFEIIGISGYEGIENEEASDIGIHFYGKQPHDRTIDIVSNADFSILLRRKELYALAGFSTKVAESMWLGVPVLCTLVGGTDNCIDDNVNGFIVQDNQFEMVLSKICEIINLDADKMRQIKNNAYEYAHEHFSHNKYVEPMKRFCERI